MIMSDPSDSATKNMSPPMDTKGEASAERKDSDSLGEMINSAAMSILDGEDFTMGPVPVKTRTGKKKDHVKRPMNAFMVYAQVARKLISKSNSNLQNSEISKKLGELWRRTDEVSKRAFIEKAELLRQNHKKEHPDYKYQPRRKKTKTVAGNNGRMRSPVEDIEELLPQNPIRIRQSRGGRGSKNGVTASGKSGVNAKPTTAASPSSSSLATGPKAFDYCGPVSSNKGGGSISNSSHKTKDTNSSTSSLSSSTSSSCASPYSNYLYGFPGKPYLHHNHTHNISGHTVGHQSGGHPLSTNTTIPSSPAHSQTSVHSNLSTPPPTTTTLSIGSSAAFHRSTDSSSPNLSGPGHLQQPRTYGYGLNSYEVLLTKEDGKTVQHTTPMIHATSSPTSRSIDWYQKYDEQCSSYPQHPGNNNSSWSMNYPGYAHTSPVVASASGAVAASGGQYPGSIMETDVDPKELEQYLDNPAAARKVPSSVYTSHTRDDMFLDMQPGNGLLTGGSSCGSMQIPTPHLQPLGLDPLPLTHSATVGATPTMTTTTLLSGGGGVGGVGLGTIVARNDYYVSGGGGYETRYKDFY